MRGLPLPPPCGSDYCTIANRAANLSRLEDRAARVLNQVYELIVKAAIVINCEARDIEESAAKYLSHASNDELGAAYFKYGELEYPRAYRLIGGIESAAFRVNRHYINDFTRYAAKRRVKVAKVGNGIYGQTRNRRLVIHAIASRRVQQW